jgi:hypothetical protein
MGEILGSDVAAQRYASRPADFNRFRRAEMNGWSPKSAERQPAPKGSA